MMTMISKLLSVLNADKEQASLDRMLTRILNRRVTVENELAAYAMGKRTLTPGDAREMARYLGDPNYERKF